MKTWVNWKRRNPLMTNGRRAANAISATIPRRRQGGALATTGAGAAATAPSRTPVPPPPITGTTRPDVQKGPDARRRPPAAREAYSLYVERAAAGANEADGPFSTSGYTRRTAGRPKRP